VCGRTLEFAPRDAERESARDERVVAAVSSAWVRMISGGDALRGLRWSAPSRAAPWTECWCGWLSCSSFSPSDPLERSTGLAGGGWQHKSVYARTPFSLNSRSERPLLALNHVGKSTVLNVFS
jgi:hypothetical protein